MNPPISHADVYRRDHSTTLPPMPRRRANPFLVGFTVGVLAAFASSVIGAALVWAVLS